MVGTAFSQMDHIDTKQFPSHTRYIKSNFEHSIARSFNSRQLTDMATLLDWGNVEAATAKIEKNLCLSSKQEAFILLCLTSILKIDFDEARGCVTDGGDDRGIDAVYLDERFGRRVVHIFQTKFHSKFSSSNRNFPSGEIDKILGFLGDCLAQVDGFIDTCNPLLQQKVIDVWDFIKSGSCEVEIHLCSNGEKLVGEQRARFESSLVRFKFIHIRECDLDALSNSISQRSAVDREIELRIVEEQLFERTDGNVRAVIGTVRADEFIEALTDPLDNMQMDANLFEENVRVYLGEQNDINRRIYDTAISDEAGLFWYFNNGITIVCERFSYQPGFKNAPLRLSNPQVVNGGQTSHALFQASKASLDALQRVRLLVRIIETQEKSLYAKVAEATNSQTPIRSRDLRSNDPLLVRLEASLASLGWFLDRKRDQHSDQPEEKRIDALKLGQIWLAYVRGEPDKAKTASDRIFGEYFPLVFDPSEMDAERAISVWRLYNEIEIQRRKKIQESRNSYRRPSDMAHESFWIVEGVYHLAFAIKKYAENANIDIFDFEKIKPLIPEAMTRIANFVKERPGISLYRLFRTAATKRYLFTGTMEGQQFTLNLETPPR